MRRAAILLCLFFLGWFALRPGTDAFAQSGQAPVTAVECREARGFLTELRSAGGLVRWDSRPQAVIERARWVRMTPDERSKIIWSLAKVASCSDRKMEHEVRIVEDRGPPIRVQRVSLDPQCRGDQVDRTIWYRC